MKGFTHKNLPVFSFVSADEFYTWLNSHHKTQQSFWLRYYKKGTGKPTIAHTDAVDVALCWGWIDGLINKYDEESYLVRFTPRGKKSVWSKINVEKVAKLTAEGLMQPSGLAHVESAKADGRWDAAYAGQATITLPDSFVRLLHKHPKANNYYNSLTKAEKYSYAYKLATTVGAEKRTAQEAKLLLKLQEKAANNK